MHKVVWLVGEVSEKGLKRAHSLRRYAANAKQYFEEYLPGPKRTVFHTKKGLSWRNAWGVLRYSANNAFIAFVYADQVKKQVHGFRTFFNDVLQLSWSLCASLLRK